MHWHISITMARQSIGTKMILKFFHRDAKKNGLAEWVAGWC